MMLDDLCTRIRHNKCRLPTTLGPDSLTNFLRLSTQAEKFNFGELPLESMSDEEGGFHLPTLTDDEREWWFTGLIPLPAPICWYEFSLNNIVSGLLIRKANDGRIWVTRNEPNFIDDVWVSWNKNDDKYDDIAIEANEKAMKFIERTSQKQINQIWLANGHLAAYLTLMINSKSSEVKRVTISKDSNRLRRQLNKVPLSDHTRVIIVPQRYLSEASSETKPGSPKRLHWRRSHLRILHRGLPEEKKIVVARHLVGKRELGEIIHDCYEVRIS
jgi:hypothetical protein